MILVQRLHSIITYVGCCLSLNLTIFPKKTGPSDQFGNFDVSVLALRSLILFEIQRNSLMHAKGDVILYKGHHLAPNPTDIQLINTDSDRHINKRILWGKKQDIQFPCFSLVN